MSRVSQSFKTRCSDLQTRFQDSRLWNLCPASPALRPAAQLWRGCSLSLSYQTYSVLYFPDDVDATDLGTEINREVRANICLDRPPKRNIPVMKLHNAQPLPQIKLTTSNVHFRTRNSSASVCATATS